MKAKFACLLCFYSQPRKLNDNLVQHFSLPDETPPILEAEMTLRAEQLVNGERGRHTALTERKTSSPRQIISPDPHHQKTDSKPSSPEVRHQRTLSPATEHITETKTVKREEVKVRQEVNALKQEVKEKREEPDGQLTVTPVRDEPTVAVV